MATRTCILKKTSGLRRETSPLIAGLVEEGFIELDKEQAQKEKNSGDNLTGKKWYKLTERGHQLCNATAAKPVHRKNADEAIQGLMERVRIVNEDARFLCRITVVVLYGSYLRGVERPADVDVAMQVERKIDAFEKFHEACWKHLHDSGRACQRIGYELDFPRLKVFVFLKQRKRTLSLHSLHDFIGMEKRENFSYEVLFGDKDAHRAKAGGGNEPSLNRQRRAAFCGCTVQTGERGDETYVRERNRAA